MSDEPKTPRGRATRPVPLPALAPGDRVAVVAPSSPIREPMLREGIEVVRSLGLEPVVRDDVGARERFTAGSAERRALELSEALADEGVRAVWAARGGYGVLPLLRTLGRAAPAAKPILGESDATALGCWALAGGVAWIHAPMVASSLRLGAGVGFDEVSLRAALFAAGGVLSAPAVRTLRAGSAEGVVVGGCLTLLASLAGTPWQLDAAGSLILVEDVGVKPYQVHRCLEQLFASGSLDGLAGVLLGDFSGCQQHPDQGYDMDEVFLDFFDEVAPGVPITVGWPVGHADAPHLSVPMGVPARLDAPPSGVARLEWSREARPSC